MKHLRTAAALALALALALSLFACDMVKGATSGNAATAGNASDISDDAVVAKVGEREITRGELVDEYNSMLSMYTTYYGMPAPTNAEEIEGYQDMALEGLVSDALLLNQAEKMGLSPLNDEDAAAVKADYDTQMDDLLAGFVENAKAEGAEDPDARALEMIAEALTESGWSVDYEGYKAWFLDFLTEQKVLENLEKTYKESVKIDESAGQTYYDDLVAAQTETYKTTPAEYLAASEGYEMDGGTPVLNAPEGFLRVKVITIAPENEADASIATDKAAMEELEAEYGKLSLTDAAANKARIAEIVKEYKTLSDKVSAASEDYMKDARAKAAEAMQKLTDGAAFDDVLKEYGDDEAYATYKAIAEKGRLLQIGGEDGWDEAVHKAAEQLKDGAYSEILESGDTLYIVQRVGAEEAKTVPYADVSEEINTLAADEQREAAWTEQQNAWTTDISTVTYHEENFRDIGK